jgi:arginase
VPYSSTGRPDGISRGTAALRTEGLMGRLAESADLRDAGDLILVERDAGRGRSGLCNEPGLAELIARSGTAVARARLAGRWPLLVGGDCPAVLGPLAALRSTSGASGMLMIDGHEDAWPPWRSPTGEASDSELAIALGLVGDLPDGVDGVTGVLEPSVTVLVGPRDGDELRDHAVPSIAGHVGMLLTDRDVRQRGADALASAAVMHLDRGALAWWLHVDLDVLSSDAFPAADYLQPGGLDWAQLTTLTTYALSSSRCAGASVVIYNADLDPDRRVARRTIDFLAAAFTAERS